MTLSLSTTPCVLQLTRRKSDNQEIPEITGRYVLQYDPRRDHENYYYLTVTDDRTEAKVFVDRNEAMLYYFQSTSIPHPVFGHVQSQPLAEEFFIEIVFLPITGAPDGNHLN